MADTPSLVRALQTRPIKRIARPEDVAGSVLFLASDRLAGLISGEVVTVAGGMEGRLLHQPDSIDPSQA